MVATAARLVLRKNQDRRVRGGHPWVFSNEVAQLEGEPANGDLVEIMDFRGAYLGRAYYNRNSLICARLLTRSRDAIDAAFFVKRIERALRYRGAVLPGAEALRVVYGEADQLPGLVVDRYGDVLAVQILTLGIERRADLVREALEQVLAPRGAVRLADSPLRALEGLPQSRSRASASRRTSRAVRRPGCSSISVSIAGSPSRARTAGACSTCSATRASGRSTPRAAGPARSWRWTPRSRRWRRPGATWRATGSPTG